MKKYLIVFTLIFAFVNCGKEFDPEDYGTFTDKRDGKFYRTVIVGTQTWMAENLKYLPEVITPVKISDSLKYYYVYDYYGANVERAERALDYKTFGVLYNFPAALDACPEGWHLPDREEWEELKYSTGLNNGSELRSSSYWASGDNGSNKSGFNSLPAGCQENSRFRELGHKAGFWSTVIPYSEPGNAYVWGFNKSRNNIESVDVPQEDGYPVRCIKDH